MNAGMKRFLGWTCRRAGALALCFAPPRDGAHQRNAIGPYRAAMILLMLILTGPPALSAESPATVFEHANKLYEQGKFPEAAAAYEQLLQSGHGSAALFYNLGNAWFKAGQHGRAIAAYRQAEKWLPRDPNLHFNLQFVRKKVSGSETTATGLWHRALRHLTLNEWTILTVSAYWLWFLLLGLREFRPGLRRSLRGYTATAGMTAVLLAGCLTAAAYEQSRLTEAVVVVPEAVVRHGPLEESQVKFQLRDGSEIVVLDEKELLVGDKRQSWLQVQDGVRGIGWLKRDQVIVLAPAKSESRT